jgi:hypothetical protein
MQGVLQTFKAISDYANKAKPPSMFLVVSIVSSLNSVAAVVLMFFEGQATKNAKWYFHAGLYLYHLLEVSLRTATLAIFGFAVGRYSFIAAPFSLLLRFLIKAATKDSTPLGLTIASFFLDSAFSSVRGFRAASALTLVECAIVVVLVIAPSGPLEHKPEGAQAIGAIFLGCIGIRCILHRLVMEKHSKYSVGKNETSKLEHEQGASEDAQEVAEAVGLELNPIQHMINAVAV